MEYLLKSSDLADIPKYTRRSPYADGTRITLYLRTDVEEIAIKKWGSYDKLNKEKARLRNLESHNLLRSLFAESRSLHDPGNPDSPSHFSLEGQKTDKPEKKGPTFWKSGSTKVVMSAILVNGANTLFKMIAWIYTGSHSMFSEFIHSAADTMNQVSLSQQTTNAD